MHHITTLLPLLSLALPHLTTATYTNTTTWWTPLPSATWNIALSTTPSTFSPANKTSIYDLDLFDTSAATIASLHASGHKVICYYSAGSWENWRPDASSFPSKALGKPLDGWAGERWHNTSDATVRSLMAARIRLARDKRCDGVDPDNIDGYGNDSGMKLTTSTAVDYVRFLSAQAHALGLASGLKNGGDIVGRVLGVVDWEVNEQCALYNECDTMRAFLAAGKPVFHIEYTAAAAPGAAFVKKSCGGAAVGFSSVIKHMALGTWTVGCPSGAVVAF